ncbi:NADH-quinone oxidoreductase subunit N [Fontivita pretiosa]|uniref:NADH-quinone oxidoreductase subunit N n=1 Tax=Fontivita pretiosa TaxID=2989684 RepID=UPI003D16A7B8
MNLVLLIIPELILVAAACALFVLGVSSRAAARQAAPVVALLALLVVFFMQTMPTSEAAFSGGEQGAAVRTDSAGSLRVSNLADYIRLLGAGLGALFVMLAWPAPQRQGSGNAAVHFGNDAGEFFALLLLSIAGLMLVASANDIILLFLGIELASIPTYIMVSISRPLPAAQEAGVKYFFLGAMSAAVMLFGFSYLYGTTGVIRLHEIGQQFAGTIRQGSTSVHFTPWQLLAVVLLISGFAFKMAAVPLHFYAGDVYEGAATPVTALLSFVPKAAGFVALLKVLFAASGGLWLLPQQIGQLLWVLAALTMTVGNVLGLLQHNVKRLLAYSSIAHTGYMLVGVTALATSQDLPALQGVLFYLAAYGLMNVAAFGVLELLPARGAAARRPATTAETFDDLVGSGGDHPGLGLIMAVACFSLIGLPLTIGFFGKVYLILPAWRAGLSWLVVIMVVNAAISAAYYLRIVATMFLRAEPQPPAGGEAAPPAVPGVAQLGPTPILLAAAISAAGTLLFGTIFPATEVLRTQVVQAAVIDAQPLPASVTAAAELSSGPTNPLRP